jgi:hypothetical protein
MSKGLKSDKKDSNTDADDNDPYHSRSCVDFAII